MIRKVTRKMLFLLSNKLLSIHETKKVKTASVQKKSRTEEDAKFEEQQKD